jgi:phosphonate transport system substrate-binding protein
MVYRRLAALGTALLVLLCVAGCTARAEQSADGVPSTLRIGIIPNISPEKQRALYEPFRRYVSKRLGVKAELFVATDYAGVVTALVSKRIDIAYLGGLTYVLAAQQAKVTPLVTEIDQETGTRRYISAIVVRSTSRFTMTRDIVAAHGGFAFGDPSSTSGSLYPRQMLVDAGAGCSPKDITRCPPLTKVVFTGAHDATAQAVYRGSVDAGGIELRILHRLEHQGTIPKGALRVIDTRQVMGYPWVAREGLGGTARDAITRMFTEMTDPSLLDLMRAKRYAAVSAADYAEIRAKASDLGLLTPARR